MSKSKSHKLHIGRPRQSRPHWQSLIDEMERAGISQADLCRILGIESNNMSRWQNGERTPQPEMVDRIATALYPGTDQENERNNALIRLLRDAPTRLKVITTTQAESA